MPRFCIPVTWKVAAHLLIDANSLQEALAKVDTEDQSHLMEKLWVAGPFEYDLVVVQALNADWLANNRPRPTPSPTP